jgi:cell division protein ZapA
MNSNRVRVSIFGKTYSIQGEASDEYIQKLARYVDGKMHEISDATGSGNIAQIAILTALNIADEFYQLKEQEGLVESDIAERAKALISMLEEGLIGDVFGNSGTNPVRAGSDAHIYRN